MFTVVCSERGATVLALFVKPVGSDDLALITITAKHAVSVSQFITFKPCALFRLKTTMKTLKPQSPLNRFGSNYQANH